MDVTVPEPEICIASSMSGSFAPDSGCICLASEHVRDQGCQ